MNRLLVGTARVALSCTLAGLAFAAVAEQRTVDVSDLARCRAISGAGERLACYDSLEARAVAGARNAPAATDTASSRTAATPSDSAPAPAAAAATGAAIASGAAAGAATNPGAATASGAQAGGTAAAAARSTDLDDPANFGLSPHQVRATPKGPDRIKAVVTRMSQDRLNNVDLVLDNGQTWRLIDSDPRVRPGDSVTISRAALGSFLLVAPSRRSYRVERTN